PRAIFFYRYSLAKEKKVKRQKRREAIANKPHQKAAFVLRHPSKKRVGYNPPRDAKRKPSKMPVHGLAVVLQKHNRSKSQSNDRRNSKQSYTKHKLTPFRPSWRHS